MATEADLYRLLVWSSPSYPIGAFSYSHGLEWAVEDGSVRNVATLVDYVSAVISRGGGWIDAVLFVQAHRAAHDAAQLDAISELASAFRASSETALEARQQGAAFLLVTRRAWPHVLLDAFAERQGDAPVVQAVTMALACAAHGIVLEASLNAFLHATVSNLVSAGVRLVPLGQTDGQRILAALEAVVAATAERALGVALADVGGAVFRADIASMRHETQYTRLFRS